MPGDVASKRAITGVEVGDPGAGEVLRQPPDQPLGRRAKHLVSALLGGSSAHDLVGAFKLANQLGDPVVGVGHVGIGPNDDGAPGRLRSHPARTARALVDPLANQPDAVAGHQVVDRAVSGCVIDNDDLPRVPARLQARSNSSEFGVKMAGLVVDGEYDGDIQLGRR